MENEKIEFESINNGWIARAEWGLVGYRYIFFRTKNQAIAWAIKRLKTNFKEK